MSRSSLIFLSSCNIDVLGVNIDNCNHPCVGQPCMNGGICLPIRDFYKCSCPLGFENTNCEDSQYYSNYFDIITNSLSVLKMKSSFM